MILLGYNILCIYKKICIFLHMYDDTRAYSKDLGIKLEEPEKLKISLK